MANMKYLNQYEKENIRQIRLKINRKTEPELLEWVEKQENIQGYIKLLIREDMERKRKAEEECRKEEKREQETSLNFEWTPFGAEKKDEWLYCSKCGTRIKNTGEIIDCCQGCKRKVTCQET